MRLVPKSRLLEALKPPTRAFSGLCALVGGDAALEMGVKLGREGWTSFLCSGKSDASQKDNPDLRSLRTTGPKSYKTYRPIDL